MTEMPQQPKVLIVEDDPLLSDLLSQKFTLENFEILYAPTGESALDILKREKPDIILLDILLPGMDGFAVLKQIKADPATKDIMVIILSNLGQESDLKKGTELGAEKFIVKVSLSLSEVIDLVRSVWGGRAGTTTPTP